MTILTMLMACISPRRAVVEFDEYFSNDSVYVPEDETEPEPDHVPERKTVKVGDELTGGFRVKRISGGSITVKGSYECWSDGNNTGDTFTIKLGQKAAFYDTGILDASHTVYIEVLEIR